MIRRWSCLAAAVCLATTVVAQDPPKNPFPREGGAARRAQKDPLEGKAPPALAVDRWLNTKAPLTLAALRGKVVLLDFWGVW